MEKKAVTFSEFLKELFNFDKDLHNLYLKEVLKEGNDLGSWLGHLSGIETDFCDFLYISFFWEYSENGNRFWVEKTSDFRKYINLKNKRENAK